MHFTQTVVIKGAGFFNGTVEGKEYRTGQIFVEEPFDASNVNYKGFRTVEYKCTDTDVVKPVMHLPFPITGEIDMEMSATKRGQVCVCKAIRPKEIAHAAPAPRQVQQPAR